MRAVLLAIATVTTLAGLRSIRDRTQAPVCVVLVSALRITEVAPTTRSFLRQREPNVQHHGKTNDLGRRFEVAEWV